MLPVACLLGLLPSRPDSSCLSSCRDRHWARRQRGNKVEACLVCSRRLNSGGQSQDAAPMWQDRLTLVALPRPWQAAETASLKRMQGRVDGQAQRLLSGGGQVARGAGRKTASTAAASTGAGSSQAAQLSWQGLQRLCSGICHLVQITHSPALLECTMALRWLASQPAAEGRGECSLLALTRFFNSAGFCFNGRGPAAAT